jgi:AcrR family transcriptional regulator
MKLTQERILEAALAVVDADGWEGLSMRRLAQDLDVWPMAVYRHFRDKEELVEAVAAAAADRVAAAPEGGAWDQRLAALLRGLVATPAIRTGGAVPGGARLTAQALGILEEAGFAPADAVTAWRAAFAYAAGFDAQPAERTSLARLDGIAPQALVALGRPPDFEAGLRLVLDGIAASHE